MENMTVISVDTVVVGSGAAGYSAACRLQEMGKKSVALVTEGVNIGTSRNTGSDKQTYYKLGLGGAAPDSVRQMAENLFSCGAVDGDNALCEAALSARCFLRLCELGVPFPVNRFGEYIGYKTDHDPFARATSAGPLTSKFMTEALQRRADACGVTVYDGLTAVEILKNENGVCGLVCLQRKSGDFAVFRCAHAVLATGGPAGIYADSVYPACHNGSTGLALAAGAALQNATEWQYGLASVSPRWNVSGTYMQVLPRFISVDENGKEYEFLREYFRYDYAALSAVFLKGYQWPFDSRKVMDGSSVIDLLVYRECVLRRRRVYLDYRTDPFDVPAIAYEKLIPEAYAYLKNAGVCGGTPIERLEKMNAPAVALYAGKGVDLHRERLEIALCAQHHNGGIAVDLWWQTRVRGLFAVGECAGTHGITRPGGSALNAGQVGALRSAQYISADKRELPAKKAFSDLAAAAVKRHKAFCKSVLRGADTVKALTAAARRRMSDAGAAIRAVEKMQAAREETETLLRDFSHVVGVCAPQELWRAYALHDMLLTQSAVLFAMLDFAEKVGITRGSALYTDKDGDLRDGLEDIFRFTADDTKTVSVVQEVGFIDGKCTALWRPVRPLPAADDFFENVWRGYRENGNIY